MDTNNKIAQLESQVMQLQSQVTDLSDKFYKNNFSSSQVFNKTCEFTSALKVPSYTSLPAGEIGHIAEMGGKLYICTTGGSSSVWTLVGSQV